MSTSNQRKARRRKTYSPIDYVAEQEGEAIVASFSSHTIDFGKRMNIYYWVGNEKFLTGKKHRRQAIGMSECPKAPKVRHKVIGSKQINLRAIAIDKRLKNPQLYRTLDTRRVIHLVEYKTGRG